jgi:hypothetical protein
MQTNGRKSSKKAKKINDAAAVALADEDGDHQGNFKLDVDEMALEVRKKTRNYAKRGMSNGCMN